MSQLDSALPLDYRSDVPIQVGRIETRDSNAAAMFITASVTAAAAAITVTSPRVYLITCPVSFHIEARHDTTAVTAATTSSPKIPAGFPLVTWLSSSSRLSVIKATGESDSTIWITPL